MRADHGDLATDIFFQQLLRRQQVEIEVLFDEGERRPGGCAQQGGFGAHLRRNFAQRQARETARQVDAAALLDQRQVVVVNGHGNRLAVGGGGTDILCRIGGVGQGGGQEAGGEQVFHGFLLCAAGNDSMGATAVSWRNRHPPGSIQMKKLIAALLLTISLPALAALDVSGVKFEDKTKVGAGETVINGAGLRKRAFFKVYAIGLYLPQKVTSAADAINAKGAKRVAIVTLRDLTAEQFVDALIEALKNNHDEAALKALQPKIDQFRSTMLTIGNAPEKSAVNIDWLPESGTRLSFNGSAKGSDIPGEDFYRALLKIWIGDKPAQEDLKEQLLGKAQ
jgi:hypothetical protein